MQRGDFDVAVQFFVCCSAALVQMTSALQKSECCSAVSAAQHSKNCSATSVFACGMLQGWGLEGWGLGLPAVVRLFRWLFFGLFAGTLHGAHSAPCSDDFRVFQGPASGGSVAGGISSFLEGLDRRQGLIFPRTSGRKIRIVRVTIP